MAFDAFVLHAVQVDIEKRILQPGLKVQRVTQLGPSSLLLEFRRGQSFETLFISINPGSSRLHLTSRHYTKPATPPAFCMLLRKHLSGGQLLSLEQPPLERVLYLHFLAVNEQGRETHKTLVAEIMGRHSNLVLIKPGPEDERPLILGCLKPVPPALNRYRTILPNQAYYPPPLQEKLHPFALSYDVFQREAAAHRGMETERFLLDNFQGFSPFLAREVASRAGSSILTEDILVLLWEKIQELLEIYISHKWQPTLLHNREGLPDDFFAFQPRQPLAGHTRRFPSMSELLDEFYAHKERFEERKGLYGLLEQQIKQNLQKNRRKEKKQRAELEETNKAEELRRMGELIYMNLHNIPPKSSSMEVDDVFAETGKIIITLDPGISPSQNAQRYFKKYRKARKGAKEISRQLKTTRREIAYLESVLYALEEADLDSLREIREELAEAGYIPAEQPGLRGRQRQAAKPLALASSSGETIFVGRNNRQNDELTQHLAAKTDYWLHAKNIPGAHVIIRSSNPHEKTLEEAAMLAAHFSRASRSSNVPIDYTLVKNLKKIPGGRPGMVTYSHYKTIFITPDPTSISQILSRSRRQKHET